jgi:hypothetical protein
MTAIWMWCRSEWRNRWKALLGLVVLIAFATAGVSTAVAGARRGATTVDRLLADTLPATLAVLPNMGQFDWDVVRAMPQVESVTGFAVGSFRVEGVGDDATAVSGFPPVDDEVWRSIERPFVLDGRLPDPSDAGEVVVTTNFRSRFGKEVGDDLRLRLYTPAQIDAYDEGEPLGPIIDAQIVGVIRSGWFSDPVGSPAGAVFPSPGLFQQHPSNFLGDEGTGNVNALVRLTDREPGTVETFEREFVEITGLQNVETFDLVEAADHYRNLVGFEARALMLLAAAAAAASVLLLGLTLTRFCAASFQGLDVLRSFGLRPVQSRVAVAAAPAVAAVVGAVAGLGAAMWASKWFPIGTAALIEPTPGLDVDLAVLAASVASIFILVVGLCIWSARASRRLSRDLPATGGAMVGPLTASWPLRVGMGARLALEGGAGRSSTSGRSALVAGVIAVAGVVAALTFSAGITDATDGYRRFGQTYELGAFFGSGGVDQFPADAQLATLAADPGVDGVTDAYNDVATAERGTVSLFTYDADDAPIDVVTLEGRLPITPSEIALAPMTADEERVGVGDTLTLTGTIGTSEFTVTGIAFIPTGPHNSYAQGGWILPQGFAGLFDSFRFHFGLVSTAPGVDPDVVVERAGDAGIQLVPGPIIPPVERDELVQLRSVPLLLAGFLAVLGVGAIAHTLTSTARRRRHDFAMLRALGMRPRDTSIVIFVQAGVIAFASLVVGVPIGITVGRLVWRTIAIDTPVQHLDPTSWEMLAGAVAVVWGVALLAAVWPSRRLASLRLGAVLRYE